MAKSTNTQATSTTPTATPSSTSNVPTARASQPNIAALDQALAAARARVEAKEGPSEKTPKDEAALKAAREAKEAEKAKKAAERAQARADRKVKQEEERAVKKAAREAKRAEREAERAAKGPAHLSKVAKAAAKLPALSENAQGLYKRVMKALTPVEVTAVAQHLLHALRVQATIAATNVKLTEGQLVRITGGDPRYIGQVAKMFKVQRIRCYVVVEGNDKPIYLFTSDVEPISTADAESLPAVPAARASGTGTEG